MYLRWIMTELGEQLETLLQCWFQINMAEITTTFSPISGGFGRVLKNDGGSYAANHDAATGSATDSIGYTSQRPAGGSHEVARFFAPFDTSSIGGDSVITAATIRLIANGGTFNNADSDTINIVTNNQANPASLAVEDFDQLGITKFGELALSSYNNTDLANNDISITDLTKISKTGNTILGIRLARDISNDAPTGENQINWTSSTMTLSVTYQTEDDEGGTFLLS